MSYTSNVNKIITINIRNQVEAGSGYVTFQEFQTQVEKCKKILKDIIITNPNGNSQNITVLFGSNEFNQNSDTLGWASGGTVAINQYNTGLYYLNDTQEHQNISVIIHEIIHVFGLFPNQVGGNITTINDTTANNGSTRRIYTGQKGIKGYKKLLLANNIKVPNPLFICIEDDFPQGTVNVHLEEAYNSSNDVYEVININGQYYPSLWNEIMSGLLDRDYNYITPMTTGCLEDLGFIINHNSRYIVTSGLSMKFVNDRKERQLGTTENYFTFSETNYDIKYLNKFLKKNDIINQSILIDNLTDNWGNKII